MAHKEVQFVKWLSEINKKDVSIAGIKGANLGEMHRLKLPVPQGFVITTQACFYFLSVGSTDKRIESLLSGLKVENTDKLLEVSEKIRVLIENSEFPLDLLDEVSEAYEILGDESLIEKSKKDAMKILESSESFVAVRGSQNAEVNASFAGNQETILNIKGNDNLVSAIKKCISSYFSPKSIYYREKMNIDHKSADISVLVQKMMYPQKSGVVFSSNPINYDKNVVIEAVLGSGDHLLSGAKVPDRYTVHSDLDNFKIIEEVIKDERVLSNYEIKRLALYAKELQGHFGKDQEIEFGIEKENIFLLESMPINDTNLRNSEPLEGNLLFKGSAAGSGTATGKVKFMNAVNLDRVNQGDILVMKKIDPALLYSAKKASAYIFEEGCLSNYLAVIAREMGIPVVFGISGISEKLKEGDEVTVDSNFGKVYLGKASKERSEVSSGKHEQKYKNDSKDMENIDIEEQVLKELGGSDYSPGIEEKDKDIPKLNDSVVIDSDSFETDD